MTKKHYEAIAKALSIIEHSTQRAIVTQEIAIILKKENLRFQQQKFTDAVEKSARK
jgi:hypothetical protein